jgi:hypothetical protein
MKRFSQKWLLFTGSFGPDDLVFIPTVTQELNVSESPQPSVSVLHKQWVKLENEYHRLAVEIDAARTRGTELEPMRERQTTLLLQINALVAEIRNAPATTTRDFLALLDVALEHELDLASDIAFYGPADYPMISRLLRALACKVPEFEFNSLRRWLSSPGQFEQLMGDATPLESEGGMAGQSNQQCCQINSPRAKQV